MSEDGTWRQSFHSELEIGGVLYQDVDTEEILDVRFLEDPEQLRIVTIASVFGLVQHTRVNGSEFSRVS